MGQIEHEVTPGTHAEAEPRRLTVRVYVPVGAALVLMTLIAVTLAYSAGTAKLVVAVILLALAAVGVLLEALYFMHLRVNRRMFRIFFGAGVGVAIVMGLALTVLLQFVIPASGK